MHENHKHESQKLVYCFNITTGEAVLTGIGFVFPPSILDRVSGLF